VLEVINSSPGDLAPVFDAMLDKAMDLCGASLGFLTRIEGENFNAVALRGAPPALAEFMRQSQHIMPGQAHHRVMQGADVIHIEDIEDITAEDVYRSGDRARRALADIGGARTGLCVALRKESTPLGAIIVYRQEVRPFTDKQISLLQNFAAQALIAMENARLLGELRGRTADLQEALEYQTATSDVLNVISRSTANVQPVLDTVVETAARLCDADTANITIREGEVYRYASSSYSASEPEFWAIQRQRTVVPGRETLAGRVALEGRVVHVADIRADPDFAVPETVAAGRRTVLGVPLLRAGAVIGTINLARNRVERSPSGRSSWCGPLPIRR